MNSTRSRHRRQYALSCDSTHAEELVTSIDDRLNHIIGELIGSGITLEQALDVFEAKYIAAAMHASDGNVTRASRTLGVHRNTLHNKLRTQNSVTGYVAKLGRKRSRPRSGTGSGSKRTPGGRRG